MNDKHFEKFQYTYKLITERSILYLYWLELNIYQ